MKTYEEMKVMLGGCVEGFTEDFYKTYVKEYRMNLIHMMQPSLFADVESFSNSKKFGFYNTPSFFRFLEIFNSTKNLNKYKFTYKNDDDVELSHMYHLAENEYMANELAKFMAQYGGSEHYELQKVA